MLWHRLFLCFGLQKCRFCCWFVPEDVVPIIAVVVHVVLHVECALYGILAVDFERVGVNRVTAVVVRVVEVPEVKNALLLVEGAFRHVGGQPLHVASCVVVEVVGIFSIGVLARLLRRAAAFESLVLATMLVLVAICIVVVDIAVDLRAVYVRIHVVVPSVFVRRVLNVKVALLQQISVRLEPEGA